MRKPSAAVARRVVAVLVALTASGGLALAAYQQANPPQIAVGAANTEYVGTLHVSQALYLNGHQITGAGATGPQGPKGVTGPTGPTGATGSTGGSGVVPPINVGLPVIVTPPGIPQIIKPARDGRIGLEAGGRPVAITPFQGETLTTSNGTWTNSPTSFSYQWEDCNSSGTSCVNIAGATSVSYTVQSSDVGHTLRVVVTASNSSGSATATSSATGVVTGSGATLSISVSHSGSTSGKFINGAGTAIQLYGVDVTGTEDACVLNEGFGWDEMGGGTDSGAITEASELENWTSHHMNAVRVPLNEACWLGIGGVPSAYSAANYQTVIENWVAALNADGIYAILDLHWLYPPDGSNSAANEAGQWPSPDSANTITFWKQVATAFSSDQAVLFDPYNEPYPDTSNNSVPNYSCWLSGCTNSTSFQVPEGSSSLGGSTVGYTTAGMQAIVTAIRSGTSGSNGSTQPILLEGPSWGADPCRSENLGGNGSCTSGSQFQNLPSDTASQLALNIHVYNNKGGCNGSTNATSCWNTWLTAANSAGMPSVITEFGAGDPTGYINPLMSWAQTNDVGFTAWAWQAGGALISSNAGSTSGTADGAAVQSGINSAIAANN